jgi:hypothetical protein
MKACCGARAARGVSGARPRAQSKKGAELIYKYPILLDACANEMQRVGDPMMTKWAEARTPWAPRPAAQRIRARTGRQHARTA